jgi:hypothetical protein
MFKAIINPSIAHTINIKDTFTTINSFTHYAINGFYRNLKTDFRGRLYYLNPINIQNNKMMRQLIKSEYVKYNSEIHEKILKQFNSKNIIIKQLYDYKCELFRRNILKHFTISLDATASMLQILGLLTNSYAILVLTNVVNNNNCDDIYNNILKEIPYEIVDRSFIKVCIMKYIYGSNINTISRELSNLSKEEN